MRMSSHEIEEETGAGRLPEELAEAGTRCGPEAE